MDKVMKKMVEGDAADRAVEVAPRKVYVVNYKETMLDNGVIVSLDRVETGVCGVVYTNEDDAKKQMWNMSNDKMNNLLCDNDNGDVSRETNEDGDWQQVKCEYAGSISEYWVSMVTVL